MTLPTRRRVTRIAAYAVLGLVACLAGAATPARAGTACSEERALLDLFVNLVSKGQVIVMVRDTDVLVEVTALRQAGLAGFGGRRETIGQQVFVSLASLAPEVSYALDEGSLTLRVTAAPRFLEDRRLDLRREARPELSHESLPSAFLNYGVNVGQPTGQTAAVETGLSLRGALVTSAFSWSEHAPLVRGLSSLTFDDRAHLRRVVVGDVFVADPLLGGASFMGGVRVAREYSIDPYFIRWPTLGMSGTVMTPSTVDVYVDNRLVRQERLQPGRFQLENVPVPNGSSQTRLVIRDAFGREQEITAPFYLTSTVLARGLQEYDYALGFTRAEVATTSAGYGRPALLARHRYGLSDALTVGGRIEARRDLFSGGPDVNVRLPVGELQLAVAASRGAADAGWAVGGGYQRVGRRVSAGLSVRALSAHYATLSLDRHGDRAKYDATGFVGTQVGGSMGLTMQSAVVESHAGIRRARLAVLATTRLAARASAFASIGRSWAETGGATEVSVGVTWRLGERTSVTALTGRDRDGRMSGGMEMQRSLPLGDGVGYRLHAGSWPQDSAAGLLQYQGRYGQVDAGLDTANGQSTARLSVAGALVAIGGSAFATRPVDQGFALVQVPGVRGVRTYLSNQPVGRTDTNGNVLVPNLLPYYGNRLSIEDADVPLDHMVSSTERTVAIPYRGGARVVFPTRLERGVTGRVLLELGGERLAPAFGDVVLVSNTERAESPVGPNGEFYLEHVAPGRHAASIHYRGIACTITFEVDASTTPVVDLGVLLCHAPRQKDQS